MNNINALFSKRSALICFIFLLPWLNPFAPGPTPHVVPWLYALAATASLLLVASQGTYHPGTSNACFPQNLSMPVAFAWLMAGLVSTGIGLLQYFGASNYLQPWINQTHYGEAFANLRQRNQFATLVNIALTALVWLSMQAQISERESRPWPASRNLLAFMAASLLAIGNAISASRTGLFELSFLCLLYAIWGQWRHALVRSILIWAVGVYAVAAFVMPYLAGLDLSEFGLAARLRQDYACSSRLVLWSNVVQLISQKPFLGWGWGELDYAHFITLYNEPRFCDILDNAHNLPLHLAVELGVPVALLVCGGFVWWVLQQKPWAERDATRQMAWAVIAVILLHSMLEYPLWYGPFQMAFGICMILLLCHQNQSSGAGNSQKRKSKRALALISYARAATFLIATLVLAFTVYAMWDYRRVSQIYLQPEARDAHYQADTLAKIRGSWLFADQVQFAELMVTPLTQANAAWILNTASAVLHYSPEPRVIERLISSAVMLGRDDEALAYLARYRAAFPKEHALWARANELPVAKPGIKPD